MTARYPHARTQVVEAVQTLSSSPETIQTRLVDATESLLAITLEEFSGDLDLTVKFARILDLIAVDRGDVKEVAAETAPYMTDKQASMIAELICDSCTKLPEQNNEGPSCLGASGRKVAFLHSQSDHNAPLDPVVVDRPTQLP